MRINGKPIHHVFGAFAVLASLVLLAAYDNLRTINRVQEFGYETTAHVTDAWIRGSWPITFDGLRPRFLDEKVFINLKWIDKNGTERTASHVPVSERFVQDYSVDNRFKLTQITIKAIPGEDTIPLIISDFSERRTSSEFFIRWSSCVAVIGYLITFALWLVHLRSEGPDDSSFGVPGAVRTQPAKIDLPLRASILALMGIGFGIFKIGDSWLDHLSYKEMLNHGTETTAELTRVVSEVDKHDLASYFAELSWKDASGGQRNSGPTNISRSFWQSVTDNGALTKKQTNIVYLEEDPSVSPIIIDDAKERQRQYHFGMMFGPLSLLAGCGAALYIWLNTKRQRARG
jgi:hypothetical protein